MAFFSRLNAVASSPVKMEVSFPTKDIARNSTTSPYKDYVSPLKPISSFPLQHKDTRVLQLEDLADETGGQGSPSVTRKVAHFAATSLAGELKDRGFEFSEAELAPPPEKMGAGAGSDQAPQPSTPRLSRGKPASPFFSSIDPNKPLGKTWNGDQGEQMTTPPISPARKSLPLQAPERPLQRRDMITLEKPNAKYVSAYQKIWRQWRDAQEWERTKSGTPPMEKIELISSAGHYKDVFRCTSKEGQVRIIKVWKEEHHKRKNLKDLTQNSMEQYALCRRLGIRCALITNEPLTDGFFAMEEVPFSMEDFLHSKRSTEEKRDIVNQVFESLCKLIESGIDGDVQPDNFRIRENGEVCLVDSREEEMKDQWDMMLKGGLVPASDRTTWACKFPTVADTLISMLKEKYGTTHKWIRDLQH